MDEYGYAAAMKMGLRMFETSSRNSGRTMRLIERVSKGDRIVVATRQMADFIRDRLKQAGKPEVEVRVVEPLSGADLSLETAARGRTFFEHTWQLAYFEKRLEHAADGLEQHQRDTSKTWPDKPEWDESALPFIRKEPSR